MPSLQYDIEGRKARMAKLIAMDAPSSIIREESWLLLYGYAGGPWRGVWWCLKNVVLDKLESVRFKLFGLPDDDLEFAEEIGRLEEEVGLEMELGMWDEDEAAACNDSERAQEPDCKP